MHHYQHTPVCGCVWHVNGMFTFQLEGGSACKITDMYTFQCVPEVCYALKGQAGFLVGHELVDLEPIYVHRVPL